MRRTIGLIGICLFILAACHGGAAPTAAPAALITCSDFVVKHGALDATADGCLGTSALYNAEYDYWAGEYEYAVPAQSTSIQIRALFSRPAAEADRPVEIHFLGGYFALARDAYYFWESESHWTDWQPTTAFQPAQNELRIVQRQQHIEGYVNGVLAGSFDLRQQPAPGKVGLFFKTPRDVAAQVRFLAFELKELAP